jgi:hypothetical protein
MSEFPRRYGRLSDHLYKFIAALASAQPNPDWGEREEIEMAIRFIKRLEREHEIEEQQERYEQHRQRQERLEKKKKANVVKLVADDNAKPKTPA